MRRVDCTANIPVVILETERAAGNVSTESWRDESILIGNLAAMQKHISAYVLHALDADAGRVDEPTAPSDEYALGTRLADLGHELQARATHRSADTRRRVPGELPMPDGAGRDRPREPRTPWSNPNTAIYI